jgi:nitrite reductase (NO-forming)/hydroxylamine reductase
MEAEQAANEAQQETEPLPEPITTPAPAQEVRQIEGTEAEEIMLNAGCTSCHQIGVLGEGHKVGPDLSDIGWQAQGRVEGMTAEDYLLQSLIDPNVYLAPECPNGPCLANIMPRDYGQRLSGEQQEIIVTFMMEQQTPTAPTESVDEAPEGGKPAPKAVPAAKTVPPSTSRNVSAVRLASILLLTLVFLVSLFIFLRGAPDDAGEDS